MKRSILSALLFMLAFFLSVPARAASVTYTWTGAAEDGNKWSTPGNWSTPSANPATTAPTAADVALFDVAAATTIDVDTATATAGQLKIASTSAAVTFGGDGTLTIAAMGDASVPVTQSQVRICNLNAPTCWTTFDCDVNFACNGKTVISGATVFNGDVCVTVGNWFGICGIMNVTPGAGMAKTVFHGAFSFAGSTTGSFYCLNEDAELVVDITDSSKTFATTGFGFSINGSAASTCGKATFKRGSVSITGTLNNATTQSVTDRFVIDGATVYVKEQQYATLTNGFHFVSGDYRVAKTSSLASAALFPLIGFYDGTLAAGCTMRHVLTASSQAMALFSAADHPSSATLNGQLCVTNAAFLALGSTSNVISDPVLRGSGELVVKSPELYNSKMTLEGLTLTLSGGFSASSAYNRALWLKDVLWRAFSDISAITGKGGASLHFCGACTIDTEDAYQSGVARTFDLTPNSTLVYAEESPTLTVKGGGTVKMNGATSAKQEYAAVTVKNGTSLSMGGSGLTKIGALTLESGANFGVTAATVPTLEIGSSVSLAGATLTVTVPSTMKAALYCVITGGKLPSSGYTITLDNQSSTSYSCTVCDGNLYVHTSAVAPTAGVVEWTGGGDGTTWSDDDNWVVAPTENSEVFFNGFSNLNVTVDGGSALTLGKLYFRPSAGGFTLSGAPLILVNSGNYQQGPLYCEAAMPVTINNDVTFSKSGQGIATRGNADLLTFTGTVTGPASGYLSIDGVFAFSGTATFKSLMFINGHANIHLIVSDGGTVNLTGDPYLRSGNLTVKAGGTLNLTNASGWDWENGSCAIALDGRISVMNGLGATTTDSPQARFTGTGRLDIGYTTIPAAHGWRGEMVGVTLNVSNRWDTTLAGKETYAAALTLSGGTLGAKGDFTYGVATDADAAAVASTPSDRALKLSGACTIDTEDPDTDVAHTIIFTDPIDGAAGALTKTGAGDVILAAETASVTNDFTGGLTLSEGRVVLAGPNTNTVAGAVAFAGGGLGLKPTLLSQCKDWTTVLVAASVTGTPVDPKGKATLRTVETANGVAIQAKSNKSGIIFYLR